MEMYTKAHFPDSNKVLLKEYYNNCNAKERADHLLVCYLQKASSHSSNIGHGVIISSFSISPLGEQYHCFKVSCIWKILWWKKFILVDLYSHVLQRPASKKQLSRGDIQPWEGIHCGRSGKPVAWSVEREMNVACKVTKCGRCMN